MTDPSGDKRFALKFRQWEKVADELREADRGQAVYVQLRRREAALADLSSEADMFVQELGLKPLGARWQEMDGYTAENLLVQLLGRSLSTDYLMMEPIEARATAEHLLDTFQMPRSYLTNVLSFDGGGLTGWNPLTELTFDAGLVIIDEQWVGLIVVAEAA